VSALRVLLIRHGETAWNREPRFQGWKDVGLCDEGRLQAEKVARALAGHQVAAVCSSPLARARETAEILAKPHRLSVAADEAFREISFGVWEGLTPEEVMARFPDAHRAWRTAPETVRFPGGEDLAIATARARAGIERLRESHAGETVIVVSHGIVVRLIVLDALGLPPARLRAVHATPGGITEIEYLAGFATVHRVNVLHHLERDLEP
jgi:broad specificity phosphatase PhoE